MSIVVLSGLEITFVYINGMYMISVCLTWTVSFGMKIQLSYASYVFLVIV
jgi:hypothetical protein